MSTNVGMTGVETFLLQLSAAQQRRGQAPHLHRAFDQREELVREAKARGIPAFDLGPSPALAHAPRRLRGPLERVHNVRRLLQLVRSERIELIHIHAVGISGLDALVAGLTLSRLPIVITHHATLTWFAPMRNRVSDLTFAIERRRANRVVMPYAAAVEELRVAGIPAERLQVIPFCIDETRFVSPPAGRPWSPDFRLLMVSRIVEGKGHRELVEAVAMARARVPGLRLTIIGDGPLRADVQNHVSRLGLNEVIDLPGLVPHSDVPRRMTEAHVNVLPSYMPGETFPLSLLEGMAMGLPAIGTRWFGIPDIIEEGKTGLVVPPRDAQALAAAIEKLAAGPQPYEDSSRNAMARVKQHFTGAAVAQAYADLYTAAMSA
jgi:glycosyltransferase involved in cell wall biosynthesis